MMAGVLATTSRWGCSSMARRLCLVERVRVEEMAKAGCSAAETERRLGPHPATVQRELKRGGLAASARQPAYMVKTLAWDHGTEIARWAQIENALGIEVCFCESRSPRQ
jgi:IS30 family transposase